VGRTLVLTQNGGLVAVSVTRLQTDTYIGNLHLTFLTRTVRYHGFHKLLLFFFRRSQLLQMVIKKLNYVQEIGDEESIYKILLCQVVDFVISKGRQT
jgi:hypothetical protein